jgi:hypothetical protein
MAGTPTQFSLSALPPGPSGRAPLVRGALKYLAATHQTVSGILDSFGVLRAKAAESKTTAAGRLSRDQVDLLRAAIVFTSSGLDAVCHRLVRDAAPSLIDRGAGAKAQFDAYLKDQLDQPRAPEGLLDAVTASDPRTALIKRYVDSKTSASFQGSSDLRRRVRELLGIAKSALPDARLTALDPFFDARNQIVHQLDYQNPAGSRIARHHRAPAEVVVQCDQVLLVAHDFVAQTASLPR